MKRCGARSEWSDAIHFHSLPAPLSHGTRLLQPPRIYKLEGLPQGPRWDDVQRLVAASSGSNQGDIRDHAMLLLVTVYGFRSGEVRHLCLDDIDWEQEVIRVRRTKQRKTQRYPLVPAVGDAILRYFREVRPRCPP